MKKLPVIVCAIICIFVIVAIVMLQQLDGRIAKMIETEGSAALGVAVSVNGVTTDLKSGTASIAGFSIENAPGFSADKAFEVEIIEAHVDYKRRVIKSVTVQQPNINAELIGKTNNFAALLENMPKSQVGNEATEQTDDSELTVTIDRLAITGSTIKLRVSQLGLDQEKWGQDLLKTFTMDDFIIENLSGTPDELSDVILAKLTRHISAQITRYASDQLKSKVKDKLKQKLMEKLSSGLK